MALFASPIDDVVTSFHYPALTLDYEQTIKISRPASPMSAITLMTDRGHADNAPDQFIVFQLNSHAEGPAILESSQIEPSIDGSLAEPDVLVWIEMLSLQIGSSESIDQDTRATLRLNFGKDDCSTDRQFDVAFWSIAAGLSLYDQSKSNRADGRDLKADFRKAFGGRPIEIPGGLGRLTFEVVKHKEPAWWTRAFKFMSTNTGKALTSVLGFPAITAQAIDVVDQLLEKLSDSQPETLFKGKPMRLALSKYARSEFIGGNPRIKMGCLAPGFAVLARGRDFAALTQNDLHYYPSHGKLAPANIDISELISGQYDDPLSDVTYMVIRVGMRGARLDPNFSYGK